MEKITKHIDNFEKKGGVWKQLLGGKGVENIFSHLILTQYKKVGACSVFVQEVLHKRYLNLLSPSHPK